MTDLSAQAGLSVEVQGEENIQRLQAALQNLQQAGARVQQAVHAGGVAASAAAAQAGVEAAERRAGEGAKSLGDRIVSNFSGAVRRGVHGPFQVLKAAATQVGRGLQSFTGGLGGLVSSAGPAAVAITGLGLAISGLLVPVLSLIAGFKLLSTTFGWAQEAAQEQIKVAGRTRRFYPELLGQALEGAEDEMRARMGVATALFGEAADSMQESITRRLTNYRLGRGLRGERDIFRRWGITPESMRQYEDQAGRIDVSRWLHLFVLQKEQLQRDLDDASGNPAAQRAIQRKLSMLSDDTTKIFGQSFTDMMNAMTNRDMVRLSENMKRAIPLGHVDNATRKAADFTVSLKSLWATFRAIGQGVGLDVAPSITSFLNELNRRMLDTKDGGDGLGRSLRNLASTLALNAWEGLRSIMDSINTEKVNSWIATVNSWSAQETAQTMKNIVTAVIGFGTAIARLVNLISTITGSYQEWKQQGGMFGRAGQYRDEQAANARARWRRWFGLGGGEEAAAGGEGGAPAAAEAGPGAPAPTQAQPTRPSRPFMFGGGTPMPTNEAGEVVAGAPPPAEAGPSAPAPTQAAPPSTGGYVQPRLRNRIQQQVQDQASAQGVAAEEGAGAAVSNRAAAPPPEAEPTQPVPTQPPAAPAPVTAGPPPPAAAQAAPPSAQAAPGAPPAPSAGPPAPGAPSPAAEEPAQRSFGDRLRGGLRTMRDWMRPTQAQAATGPTAEQMTEEVTTRNAMEALKGTAAGRAAGVMTDVERGPGGTTDLVMRTAMTDADRPQVTLASARAPAAGSAESAARWGLWGAGAAAQATGIAPGGAAIGHAIGRVGTTEAPTAADAARGMIPGMGTLEMIKRDSEQGHPVRTRLRQMLGIPDPGEEYNFRQPMAERAAMAEAATSTDTAAGAFGYFPTSGGITAEDGANFGAAAAQQFRDGLDGVNLGGYAVTSQGVPPRGAPPPTGGDTATEA